MSRGPQQRQQSHKWLPRPCILRAPTPSAGSKKHRNGSQKRQTKSEEATSPLPPKGPKRRRKCYLTPAFSGIPNTKRSKQKIRSGSQ